MLKTILKPIASLRLTVVLIVLSMVLIYAGTWAQIDTGIWQVQKKYFHSLFTWVDFATFLPRPAAGGWRVPGGFPMPGGYLLGLLLLINLISAHIVRFRLTWKRAGIILIHLGLILLLVGEGITSTMAVESQMSIDVGSYAKFSSDVREVELAIVDPSSPDHDQVAVIPQALLKTGATYDDPKLPLKVRLDKFMSNSRVLGPMEVRSHDGPKATAGSNVMLGAEEAPAQGGVDDMQDNPAAYVTLLSRSSGATSGTYLCPAMSVELMKDVIFNADPQNVALDGKTYQVAMRFKRIYKPYTVHLVKFTHANYVGTQEDRDFASLIRLEDPARNVDREVKVWMNNPLRYNGETFYQQAYKRGDQGTVLQIVSNPGWMMPYLACAIGALGLVIHFGMNLISFLIKKMGRQRKTATPLAPAQTGWAIGVSLAGMALVLIAWGGGLGYIFRPVDEQSKFDFHSFASLPISYEGRTQPLDSVARNSLRLIAGRDTTGTSSDPAKSTDISAIHWLADMFIKPAAAASYPVFRIENKEVLTLLNLEESQRYFSFDELLKGRAELQKQFEKVEHVNEKDLDVFGRKIVELRNKISLYMSLQDLEQLYMLAPLSPGEQWRPLGQGMSDSGATHPSAQAMIDILRAYHNDDVTGFDRAVASYAALVDEKLPAEKKTRFEATFNRFDPFTQCIAIYVAAFVLACLSWLFFGAALRRAAMFGIAIALVIHTAGLISRIYISGRPPVTNLASSAIFIAWGIILMSVGLEFIYRNGIGAACAGLLGFLSLCIADRLALTGDTFKVLRAVLDTNYWLATHVVMVTLGYAATFLAGFIGIMYVIGGLFTRKLDRDSGKELVRMIYGVVCFAMLFSFVGTILGGIWADQSWGRFWGWDPKENGAVLIVLSNALLLHARWGGLVKDRGIACLAIFGNIVTAWSWFGVNMLGVGLHSYGFMESALLWLLAFVLSQVLLIAVANVPLAWWRSYRVLTIGSKPGREKIPTVVPA